MQPSISIVVLNYNGLEDTRRCLQSLAAVDYPSLHVVVVDNASKLDPTACLKEEFPWCAVVRNPVNGGWSGGNNTGIHWSLARGIEQVLLLNNDTTVAPQLAGCLAEAAQANPQFGIIGPVINFMDEPDQVMTDGFLFNDVGEPGFFQRKVVPLAHSSPPVLTEVDIVNGCCMMINAAVLRRIGLIDDRFFLVHEESDFCLRARRAGFRCGLVGETLVWHKGSTSFKRTGRTWQRYYDARNLYLLLRKHLATHYRGRGPMRSRLEYLKYVYYRYALEREHGHADAADAVLEGVWDALAGQYGPLTPRAGRPLPMLRGLFELWRKHRARQRS
jgi:GT2 family glycosyltransferase